MAYPFLFLALALGSGIFLQAKLSLPPAASVIGLGVGLTVAWTAFFLKKDKACFVFILIAAMFLGSGIYSRQDREYEQNPLLQAEHDDYADFYGTLYRSLSRGRETMFLYLRTEKVRYQNREEQVRGNIRVSVLISDDKNDFPDFLPGDRVKVSARLLPTSDYRNFNDPPYRTFLKGQKIHRRAFTKSILLVEKLKEDRRGFSPLRWASFVRQKLQDKVEEHFRLPETKALATEGGVLEALLLGDRGRMDERVAASLQRSGLYHLIAISGAHIAIVSFLLFSMLRVLRVPQRPAYIILIIFLVFYALLVEGRASVMRAVIMTLAFLVGKLIWRDTHLLNTISFSAFLLLLVNPFDLFDMGFELTFISTLAIILFFPKLIKFLPRLPLKLSEMFALSVCAQLGVLPFMAGAFNRVVFSSVLLNFAAVPLVGVIMAVGYVFFPLSFLSPALADIVASALKLLIKILLGTSGLLDDVAFASYRIPTPHPLVMVGYFLFFFLLLFPFKKKYMRWIPVSGFIVFFTVLISYPFPTKSSQLRLTFLDVGQGESILVEFPGREKMLIDGGGLPKGTFDMGESVVSPFLWRKGIKRIDYLVLTHAHPDHMNGLKAVARNFSIGEFWEAVVPEEDASREELLDQLRDSVLLRRVFRGYSREIGGVRVEVLHPGDETPTAGSVSNEQSLVLRLIYGRNAVLLPADIGEDAEKKILEKGLEVRSRILKSPHHGSLTSSSEDFLRETDPQLVVISVGKGNIFGFPNREIMTRYENFGIRVLRTDEVGAVEITLDKENMFIRTAVGAGFSPRSSVAREP